MSVPSSSLFLACVTAYIDQCNSIYTVFRCLQNKPKLLGHQVFPKKYKQSWSHSFKETNGRFLASKR